MSCCPKISDRAKEKQTAKKKKKHLGKPLKRRTRMSYDEMQNNDVLTSEDQFWKKTLWFYALASKLNTGLINKGWDGMFFACGVYWNPTGEKHTISTFVDQTRIIFLTSPGHPRGRNTTFTRPNQQLNKDKEKEHNHFTWSPGRKSTPISYDRIINCWPFFSSAPQAALDKFELTGYNRNIGAQWATRVCYKPFMIWWQNTI